MTKYYKKLLTGRINGEKEDRVQPAVPWTKRHLQGQLQPLAGVPGVRPGAFLGKRWGAENNRRWRWLAQDQRQANAPDHRPLHETPIARKGKVPHKNYTQNSSIFLRTSRWRSIYPGTTKNYTTSKQTWCMLMTRSKTLRFFQSCWMSRMIKPKRLSSSLEHCILRPGKKLFI